MNAALDRTRSRWLALLRLTDEREYATMESMPRKSNSRRRNGNSGAAPSKWQKQTGGGRDISRILDPAPRIEQAADGDWYVQYMPAVNAVKTYKCPECGRNIPPRTAHLVIWQENHLFGKARAVEERRHWHSNCWRTRRMW